MGEKALALLETWGLWGAAAALLLEGMGLPFPVEVAFLGIGALLRTGHVTTVQAVLVGWAAAVVGNLCGYGAAVWGGRPLLERMARAFRIRPERLQRLERWVQRNGLTVLLITRLTHWGFAPALWLAGIMRLPWLPLLAVMVIGDLIWVSVWVLLGASLLSTNPLHIAIALIALAVAALLLRRLFRPPAEAGAPPAEAPPAEAPPTEAPAAAAPAETAVPDRLRRGKASDG